MTCSLSTTMAYPYQWVDCHGKEWHWAYRDNDTTPRVLHDNKWRPYCPQNFLQYLPPSFECIDPPNTILPSDESRGVCCPCWESRTCGKCRDEVRPSKRHAWTCPSFDEIGSRLIDILMEKRKCEVILLLEDYISIQPNIEMYSKDRLHFQFAYLEILQYLLIRL